MMAMRPELVRMDRAVHTRAGRPAWLPEGFVKLTAPRTWSFKGINTSRFRWTTMNGRLLASSATH